MKTPKNLDIVELSIIDRSWETSAVYELSKAKSKRCFGFKPSCRPSKGSLASIYHLKAMEVEYPISRRWELTISRTSLENQEVTKRHYRAS